MPCVNFNCSQMSDFKHIVNGQDTYLLGSFSPQRQFGALVKRQRGRSVHYRILFDPPAEQPEVVTWHLGPEGTASCNRDLQEERCQGGSTQKSAVSKTLQNNHGVFNSSWFGLLWDTEKTPALNWHQAELHKQEMW